MQPPHITFGDRNKIFLIYSKCLKILNHFFCIFAKILLFRSLFLILSEMENSVDPDQTAPDLGLHCFACAILSENLV